MGSVAIPVLLPLSVLLVRPSPRDVLLAPTTPPWAEHIVQSPSGSLCPGNMTYPGTCPLRHYCPTKSGAPILCPNGTYGAAEYLASPQQCAFCPPGDYCVDGTITAESDCPYDCQPIAFPRCVDSEVRYSNGDCVSSNSSCDTMCGSVGGSFILATGTCDCNDSPTLNEICDEDSRCCPPGHL
jgi:hypothetical protein